MRVILKVINLLSAKLRPELIFGGTAKLFLLKLVCEIYDQFFNKLCMRVSFLHKICITNCVDCCLK